MPLIWPSRREWLADIGRTVDLAVEHDGQQAVHVLAGSCRSACRRRIEAKMTTVPTWRIVPTWAWPRIAAQHDRLLITYMRG